MESKHVPPRSCLERSIVYGALVNCFCGLTYGYNCGIVSGLSTPLVKFTYYSNTLGATQLSAFVGLFTASILIGMVIGSYAGSLLPNAIGRKPALIVSAVFNIVPAIALGLFENYWGAFVSRLILGIGGGLCTSIAPIYVSETVPAHVRGRVASLYQLAITFAIFVAYLMNYLFGKGQYSENLPLAKWQWQSQLLIGTAMGVFLLIIALIIPETEFYLVHFKGKKPSQLMEVDAPGASPHHLVGDEGENPASTIIVSPETVKCSSTVPACAPGVPEKSPAEPLQETVAEPAVLSVGVRVKYYIFAIIIGSSVQFTGVNAILSYAAAMLESAGVANPLLYSLLIVGLWNWLSVAISLPFLDCFGRKTFMVGTFVAICICDFVISVSFFTKTSILSLVGIVFFLLPFEIGPGCLFWAVVQEAFPPAMRESGIGASQIANHASNILVSLTAPLLRTSVGGEGSFIIYGCLTFLNCGFYSFILPESKGKKVTQT